MGKVGKGTALVAAELPPMPWYRRVREKMLVSALEGASKALRFYPGVAARRRKVKVHKDIPYTASGLVEHRLDVYLPQQTNSRDLIPAIVYIHGGGFQLLSKDTHWDIAMRFAAQGYAVFNLNYRLAPKYRYPAALIDVCDAIVWVLENASRYGADAKSLALAGESAGANLATSAAIIASYPMQEEWTQRLWNASPQIQAVLAGCGIYQVSDPERFARRRSMPAWITQTLREVTAYLPNHMEAKPGQWVLADPLCWLEQGEQPERKLPAFFAFVGTRDPLLDDTRRLHKALSSLSIPCQAQYYPGGIHAFHALPWGKNTRQCWNDQLSFLARYSCAK